MAETKKISSHHVGAIALCAVLLLGLTFLKNGFRFAHNSENQTNNQLSQESYSSLNRAASQNINNIANPGPEVLGASTTTPEITNYPASETYTSLHPRGQ